MISPCTLLLAVLAALLPVVRAQDQYTVHASVVVTLTGESTPSWHDVPTKRKVLTALGAQQLHAAGQYFRARCLPLTASLVNGTREAPILGLSGYVIDGDQTYVATSDNQNTFASAQAFMQGLYPPVSVSSRVPAGLNPDLSLSNNTYIGFPLAGYQYAQIHTASTLSPGSVYVAGDVNCRNRAYSAAQYLESKEFSAMMNNTRDMYTALGSAVTNNGDEAEILKDGTWSYANAYQIYEYLAYEYEHNATIRSILESSAYSQQFAQARWLASKSAYAMLGDISQDNGIRAIAGKTLANRVLTLLKWNMVAGGSNFKISLLFGDIAPFVSFFALSSLPQPFQSDFYGLPLYGSSMVFELFSVRKNDTNAAYPSRDDLWVRFLFRNGTTYSTDGRLSDPGDLRAYPLFNRGPDQTQMPWKEFITAMSGIAVSDPGEWCEACGGAAIFCPMYNSSYSLNINAGRENNGRLIRDDDGMSPQVAGVLGFAATLAFLVCLAVAAVLIGGVRFHRVPRRSPAASGGFKGGQKMASDADLNLAKNGAVMGVSFEEDSKTMAKNERVGSWEMTSKDVDGRSRRESLDEDGVVSNPFQKPVKADERV